MVVYESNRTGCIVTVACLVLMLSRILRLELYPWTTRFDDPDWSEKPWVPVLSAMYALGFDGK